MAQRRMFSLKIVATDAFLDMPVSSRELYFQLGMYADDDGFVNPQRVMRMVGCSKNDLDVLIARRFILLCDNGVIVVKHWHINNLIRKDFYQPTMYSESKARLTIKENGSYTECQQNVNNTLTQVSLVKYRLGKVRQVKHRYREYVSLTTKEYFELRKLFGKQGTRERTENLNLYKGSTGKKYASDYLTILNWERKNKKTEPQIDPNEARIKREAMLKKLEEGCR